MNSAAEVFMRQFLDRHREINAKAAEASAYMAMANTDLIKLTGQAVIEAKRATAVAVAEQLAREVASEHRDQTARA